MSEKLIETAAKTATTGGSALVGGGAGAAIGTLIFPGIGMAIGYLLGTGAGGAGGYQLTKKWFK